MKKTCASEKKRLIAFIPASGLGKRLWPITKVIPKEMFPIGNKPVIHYIVENIARGGIRDIYIALRPSKRAIKTYLGNGKKFGVRIRYVKGSPHGINHTLLASKNILAKGPFLLYFADLYPENPCLIKEIVDLYRERQTSIDVLKRDESRIFPTFAAVNAKRTGKKLWKINSYLKGPASTSTRLVSVGISILPPTFVKYLQKTKQKEEPLTHPLERFLKKEKRLGYEMSGKIHDCSTKEGLIAANRHIT